MIARTGPKSALLILAGWTLWLTSYAVFAQGAGAIHHDMAETFAWGIEWPLGTYKHPPLAPWIVAAWFQMLPRTDTAFYALSALNAALGMLGARQFCHSLQSHCGRPSATSDIEPALLLLALTPSFGLLALTFNANTVLLAIWPWTAVAFLWTLQRMDATSGVVFGVLSGLALLGKYYSMLLLLACLLAALLHPRRDAYFRSAAPYSAVLVAILVTTPHAIWSWVNDFPSLTYALEKVERPLLQALGQALGTLFGSLGLAMLPAAALVLARRSVVRPAKLPLWALVLCLGPWLATLVLGLIGRLGISTNFLIPALFVVQALLVATTPPLTPTESVRLRQVTATVLIALMGLAPLLGYVQFRVHADAAVEPRREVATAATALWRELVGVPLRITSGSAAYGLSLPFYSPDQPSDFTDMDFRKAPWITPDRLARDGLLVVCLNDDQICRAAVGDRGAERALHRRIALSRRAYGLTGPEFVFDITLFPPQTSVAAHRPGLQGAAPRRNFQ